VGEELLERQPCLHHAVRWDAGLRDAKVQRDVRSLAGETAVCLDDPRGPRVLEANHVAVEPGFVQKPAVVKGRRDHRVHAVLGVSVFHLRIDAAAVDSDTDRTVVIPRNVGEESNLLEDGSLALVVVEVAGVVSQLVDVGRDRGRETVALLEVHDEIGRRLAPNLGQGRDVSQVVDRNADDVAPGRPDRFDLADGCLDVAGGCGAHALNGDRVGRSQRDSADPHRTRGIPLHEGIVAERMAPKRTGPVIRPFDSARGPPWPWRPGSRRR
jgi:hypothetical protein